MLAAFENCLMRLVYMFRSLNMGLWYVDNADIYLYGMR